MHRDGVGGLLLAATASYGIAVADVRALFDDPFLHSVRKDSAKIVSVYLWVVSSNFQYFGNIPTPWPTLDLDDDVERVCDVGLDGTVRHLDATL